MLNLNDQTLVLTVARDLFYTWSYSQYKERSKLRPDDQLVRTEAARIITAARKSLEIAERNFRRDFLPPPSRVSPRHPAEAIQGARLLEQISRELTAIQGQLAIHPVPDDHQMGNRFFEQTGRFEPLVVIDEKLIGQTDLFRDAVEGKTGKELIAESNDLLAALSIIAETVKSRQQFLVSLEKLSMR